MPELPSAGIQRTSLQSHCFAPFCNAVRFATSSLLRAVSRATEAAAAGLPMFQPHPLSVVTVLGVAQAVEEA